MVKRQGITDFPKIERSSVTLREKVLDAMRTAILNFQFLPGDRLVERDLCDLLGVSRTSVREALRHLESEGLVEYVDTRGPRVAVITLQDAREIYELRCALESLIVELFTLRASSDQKLDLEYALKKLYSRLEEGEMVPILNAVTEFYEVLYEGSQNRAATGVLRQLQARISFLRATSVSQNNRYLDSSAEMKSIFEAIQTGDPLKAREASIQHVKQAAKVAIGVLAEQQGQSADENTDIYTGTRCPQ